MLTVDFHARKQTMLKLSRGTAQEIPEYYLLTLETTAIQSRAGDADFLIATEQVTIYLSPERLETFGAVLDMFHLERAKCRETGEEPKLEVELG